MAPRRPVVAEFVVLLVVPIVWGCGGGLGRDAASDTTPPSVTRSVLYTGTVERMQMLPTEKQVPVVHPTTTLRVTTTLTDESGIDATRPPSLGLFPTYGGKFGRGSLIPLVTEASTVGGWQADLDFSTLDAGQSHSSAYVTIVLRATDKAGNELITTLGTFYYSNP